MIDKFSISRLAHAEFYQYLNLVVDKAKEADPVALKLKVLVDPLESILPRLLAALNKEIANEETKELAALDKLRDSNIIGLGLVVDGYAYHNDEAKKEAAFVLNAFIEAQGKAISRQNYSTQTASLTKITSTFKSDPKYVAAVNLLGLTDFVDNLDVANVAFENKFKTRNTSISEDKDVPSFGVVRTEATPMYNELLELIESRFKTAKADGEPTEPYQKLINEINTLIGSYVIYTLPSKPKPTPEEPA